MLGPHRNPCSCNPSRPRADASAYRRTIRVKVSPFACRSRSCAANLHAVRAAGRPNSVGAQTCREPPVEHSIPFFPSSAVNLIHVCISVPTIEIHLLSSFEISDSALWAGPPRCRTRDFASTRSSPEPLTMSTPPSGAPPPGASAPGHVSARGSASSLHSAAPGAPPVQDVGPSADSPAVPDPDPDPDIDAGDWSWLSSDIEDCT